MAEGEVAVQLAVAADPGHGKPVGGVCSQGHHPMQLPDASAVALATGEVAKQFAVAAALAQTNRSVGCAHGGTTHRQECVAVGCCSMEQ